ncbi:MAG: methyltransferase domain-containing protein [Ardenticatenaceae bacterium]|nr:methyltransferase domain-containing protein [Ardenticatenaceae bacterium]
MSDQPPVCDYEGSDYRTRFWENQGREYEDLTERVAINRLMAPTGKTLIDLGAGFGRLADEYDGYDRVVLFDYSRSLLREAQERLGDDPRFVYVAGDWYRMPFVAGLFDTMVQVRTIHHAADVPSLFSQLSRIGRPGGEYILEFANKRNLKAILRWLARRQSWSPFDPEPIEFVELNFDFHPKWMAQELERAGFAPVQILTTSHFRLGVLKRSVPVNLLVNLDSIFQYTGRWFQLTPSVFVRSINPSSGKKANPGTFFACPDCGNPIGLVDRGLLRCHTCQLGWRVENGLYDFKEPVEISSES